MLQDVLFNLQVNDISLLMKSPINSHCLHSSEGFSLFYIQRFDYIILFTLFISAIVAEIFNRLRRRRHDAYYCIYTTML